jgi:hypothetical protein
MEDALQALTRLVQIDGVDLVLLVPHGQQDDYELKHTQLIGVSTQLCSRAPFNNYQLCTDISCFVRVLRT